MQISSVRTNSKASDLQELHELSVILALSSFCNIEDLKFPGRLGRRFCLAV